MVFKKQNGGMAISAFGGSTIAEVAESFIGGKEWIKNN